MQTNQINFSGNPIPAITWQGEERRRQARANFDIAARIKVINPLMSLGPATTARVHGRYVGGLKLLTSSAVFVGALVQVFMPGEIVLGEVRNCSPSGDEYDIGVRILDSF